MINWNRRKYTEEQFILAWNTSESIAEVARKLNCNRNGGGYFTLTTTAKYLNLSSVHMTGQGWNKSIGYSKPNLPLSEILIISENPTGSSHLKRRLFQEGVKTSICEKCMLSLWNDAPIPLALHHINGNKCDNRLENLQILCYNCHGQTTNFGTKNRKPNKQPTENRKPSKQPTNNIDHIRKKRDINFKNNCNICGKPTNNTNYCSCECMHISQKRFNITKEELEELITNNSMTEVGKILGVTDNAVRRRCKVLGVNLDIAKYKRSKYVRNSSRQSNNIVCAVCGNLSHRGRKYCSIACKVKGQTKVNITKEELENLMEYYTYDEIGKFYNAAGKTIRYISNRLNITKKPIRNKRRSKDSIQ